MAMTVTRKQVNGHKFNIVKYDEEPITQTVKAVKGNRVTVMSRRLKTYDVRLSSELIGTDIEVGDMAVIATLKKGWKVIDIIKQEKPVLSEDEAVEDYETLFGSY